MSGPFERAVVVTVPATTPWYPGELQPVQIGVYQRRNSLGEIVYSHWDGERWCWNHVSAVGAARNTDPSLAQALSWRGLVEPPVEGYGPGLAQDEGKPC